MITTLQSSIQYLSDGTTRDFPFPHVFSSPDDIHVYVSTSTGTAETIDFGVTGDGSSGGLVSLTNMPTAGDIITIRRIVSPTQEMNYISNDNFPAESHERALDKLTMLYQQLTDTALNRAIKIPDTDPVSISMVLPAFGSRANSLLQFDANGAPGIVTLASVLAALPTVAGTPNLQISLPSAGTFITSLTISTGITGQYQKVRLWLVDGSNATPTTSPAATAPKKSRNAAWDLITDLNGTLTLTLDHTGGANYSWKLCAEYLNQVVMSATITLGGGLD